MKIRDLVLLIFLLGTAGVMILFSADAKQGAYDGFILAQNTIIPSLTPLLILFLLIMKTSVKDLLARCFGFISHYVFNLPYVTFPAVFLGFVGGYPTGALLTNELYQKEEIDADQAKRMLRFNFCGGAGFIITAVGTSVLNSTRAGVILFCSNVASSVILGFLLSFTRKRGKDKFYSFSDDTDISGALSDATASAVNSVLNITAFIMLFSAISNIIPVDSRFMPLIEITNGVCGENSFSLAQISAYLAFGGLCIHFQLFSVMRKIGIKLWDFIFFRAIGAAISYCVCRLLLLAFPVELPVFSNSATPVEMFSVNVPLSLLMVIGCFVIILDIRSKRGMRPY